jgi:hypothetical protein
MAGVLLELGLLIEFGMVLAFVFGMTCGVKKLI